MKCQIWPHRFYVSETDPDVVREIFNNFIREAKFGVVDFIYHNFPDSNCYGKYAATWVLEESHFALRTFPKKGITHCRISSCNREKFFRFLEVVEPMLVSTTKLGAWSHQLTVSQTDREDILNIFSRLIPKATFRVEEFTEYIFPGDGSGSTMSWIGTDWDLNIHTFPEDGKSDIETDGFNLGRFKMFVNMLDEESMKKMLIRV